MFAYLTMAAPKYIRHRPANTQNLFMYFHNLLAILMHPYTHSSLFLLASSQATATLSFMTPWQNVSTGVGFSGCQSDSPEPNVNANCPSSGQKLIAERTYSYVGVAHKTPVLRTFSSIAHSLGLVPILALVASTVGYNNAYINI